MSTYRMTVEYDGAPFAGWQVQPGARTVQGALEDALAIALRERVTLRGAARTDAGVHALGQVASFETSIRFEPERLGRSLTALTGPSVSVTEMASAPDGFDARFDALGKHYRYSVLCRPAPSPFLCRTSLFVPLPLDLEAMRDAARHLVGTRDFRGFRAADCGRSRTVRTLSRLDIVPRDGGMLDIDVEGDGFLKNMVRIIAGTLVAVGRGRLDPGVTARVVETGNRALAGPTAPAHGLTLVRVFYPEGWIRRRD